MDDAAVEQLVRGLEGGAPCNSTLRRLNLRHCVISPVGVKQLAAAMKRGACPNLEYLNLACNDDIGDEGVEYLVEAMEEGTLVKLRELALDRVGMGNDGARALLSSLCEQGHLFSHYSCPALKTLSLYDNPDLDDDVARELMEEVTARREEIEVMGFDLD